MSMKARFYIYALCYPDGTPFYIGKTGRDVQVRVTQHYAEARVHSNKSIHDQLVIKLQTEQNLSYKVFAWTSDKQLAARLERYLIYTHIKPLTNIIYRHKEGRLDVHSKQGNPDPAKFRRTVI